MAIFPDQPTHDDEIAFARIATQIVEQLSKAWPNWKPVANETQSKYFSYATRMELENIVSNIQTYCRSSEFLIPLLPLAETLYHRCQLVPYGGCAVPTLPPIEENQSSAERFLLDYVSGCVAWGVIHSTQFPPSEEDWKIAAARAFKAWRSPYVNWMTVAHLKGAGPRDGVTIELCPGIRLEWALSSRSFTGVRDPSPPWIGSLAPTLGVIIGEERVAKVTSETDWQFEKVDIIRRCLAVLRLLVPGEYGVEEIWVVPDDDFFKTGPLPQWCAGGGEVIPPPERRIQPVFINQEQATRSALIANKWNGKLAKLTTSIERFTMSSSRSRNEDMLIDLMIALEASLLAGNDTAQLKYRCALRGAYLLGDEQDPFAIAKLLRSAYDARSKVVHGAKRLAEMTDKDRAGYSTDEFLFECYRVVRRVLLKFIEAVEAGKSPDQFAMAIDEEIIKRCDRR